MILRKLETNGMIYYMNEEYNNNNTIFVAPSMFYSNEYSKIANIEVKYI